MKTSFWKVLLPIVAFAATACSGGSTNTDGGTTGGSTTGGGTTGGSTTSGGTTSGGTTGGGTTTGGTTGPTIGSACTPPAGAGTDPCAVSGLNCNPDASGTGNSCQLPQEFGNCTKTVGCANPTVYKCTTLGTNGNLCVQDCTATSDCLDTLGVCAPFSKTLKICVPNQCGPGSTPANGSAFFAPCNSSGTNDGTCVPFQFSSGPGGLCVASGTAPAAGPCSFERTDAGSSALCAAGSFCFQDSTNGNSQCLQICNNGTSSGTDGGTATDGGVTAFPQSCASTDFCNAVFSNGNWGTCIQSCSPDGGAACPTNTTCQQAQTQAGCFP